MAQERQRPLLDEEALAGLGAEMGVQAFQGDLAPHRLLLPGAEHLSHAPRAEPLDDGVRTNGRGNGRQGAVAVLAGRLGAGGLDVAQVDHRRCLEEGAEIGLRRQEGQHVGGELALRSGRRDDVVASALGGQVQGRHQEAVQSAFVLEGQSSLPGFALGRGRAGTRRSAPFH